MITLILSEFGPKRENAGGSDLSRFRRLEPALTSFRSAFPNSHVILYTDHEIKADVEIRLVDPPFNKAHRRYGWRCSDYYRVIGLLASKTIAIYLDTDMFVYNIELFRSIVPITHKFGICVPANSRNLVMFDGAIGSDSNYVIGEDESIGCGFISNMGILSYDPESERGKNLLTCYAAKFMESPVRGPINMWRAIWSSGVNPYFLPQQWCVCREDIEVWNPICLHVGHQEVLDMLNRNLIL